jgi:hypothetical protein
MTLVRVAMAPSWMLGSEFGSILDLGTQGIKDMLYGPFEWLKTQMVRIYGKLV